MKSRFKWREPYDLDRDKIERELTDVHPGGESLTDLSFQRDADMNTLMQRFGIGAGKMPLPPVDPSHYGDVSDAPDLREVLEIGRRAGAAFAALPPQIRSRFHNDPVELWEFVHKAENLEEARRLGLLAPEPEKPVEAPPTKVIVISPEKPAS